MANARVKPKRNATIITKQASGSAKIEADIAPSRECPVWVIRVGSALALSPIYSR